MKVLERFVPNDIDVIVSPFFGGGSFEFHVSKIRNVNIIANDKFEPLVNFWNCVKEDAASVATKVRSLMPITKTVFQDCKLALHDDDSVSRAAYYFIINRSSFSGSTCSGGFSAEAAAKRCNEAAIRRLELCDLSELQIKNEDFKDFLMPFTDEFIFLDPPYLLGKKSKLYGKNGDLHEDFDHSGLRDVLKEKRAWMLCYNDCPEVRDLYKDCVIHDVQWSYGMNKTKKSSEIVITPTQTHYLRTRGLWV